jgi:hypothetical protein
VWLSCFPLTQRDFDSAEPARLAPGLFELLNAAANGGRPGRQQRVAEEHAAELVRLADHGLSLETKASAGDEEGCASSTPPLDDPCQTRGRVGSGLLDQPRVLSERGGQVARSCLELGGLTNRIGGGVFQLCGLLIELRDTAVGHAQRVTRSNHRSPSFSDCLARATLFRDGQRLVSFLPGLESRSSLELRLRALSVQPLLLGRYPGEKLAELSRAEPHELHLRSQLVEVRLSRA